VRWQRPRGSPFRRARHRIYPFDLFAHI